MTRYYVPDESDNLITWMKDGSEVLTSFGGQTQISFPNPIQTSDQGIYEIYYNNERNQSRGGLYRLIVRECPAGKWGPPECYGICDKCYNGGVCDDKSGLCICPNNFKGPNCSEICTAGTYGAGCSQTCHCAGGGSSCDRYSGICTGGCQTGWSGDNCQIPDECEDGYYGSQCTDKCHCLNDEPCGKDTGECLEQKCALGYKVRSGQVNCQECEGGTFGLDCLQQCHCASEACETERGLCKGQCLESWIGPYCQRISRLVPVRVNPYQPSSFTCYVEGIPLPDASSVDLYRRTEDTNNRTGITRISSTVSGSERAVVFDVDSVYTQEYGEYVCILTVENVGYPSTPVTNATYVLPVIEKAPVIVSTTSTTVGLRWHAWSGEDDIGDPPLVGYDVFVEEDGEVVTDQRVDQPTTSAIVSNLTPDTDYMFRVAAVREGTGGTGPVSPSSEAITRCRSGSPSASVGLIIWGSMASLINIILVIILILVIFRRKKQRRLTAEPSPPDNARETSSKHENHAFDNSNQDPNIYEDLNTDTDPHTYQCLKKPTINIPYPDSTKSDLEDTYEDMCIYV
ncbi:tyrosine-protein kinase receptor Tie-2-like [Strongylocentrotus purpuratus]|uniref:Fibronectin type-III domain-containing protein n=1 Tax=Strongylocentrotus purpuratus TaxID=7668 RepID=A0A7M7PBE4_STRPU|nr:tyrosine-protein kinase receptor Tie-2-like [Strongylocentrotus purpuratus]